MSKLPAVRPGDFARVARKLGFALDRQKGSHAIYFRESDRSRVVIPIHNRELKPGTLHGLIEDLRITQDEFIALL